MPFQGFDIPLMKAWAPEGELLEDVVVVRILGGGYDERTWSAVCKVIEK
jgi:hypothetical protein